MPRYVLASELDAAQIRAALSDPQGQILRRIVCPTLPAEGPEAIITRLNEVITQIVADARDHVAAIGIAAAWRVDPATGAILESPDLPGWRSVPLCDIVRARTGLPTFLGHTASLAGLAEHAFGAGRGHDNMIYLAINSDIRSGVIVDGRPLSGARGLGADVGHIIVEPDGPACVCGSHGCLEALASGAAITRSVAGRIKAGKKTRIVKTIGDDPGKLSVKVVGEAAKLGDKEAIRAFRRAGRYLGIGIAGLLRLFNPTLIVIGGSVVKAGPLLFDPMWAAIKEFAPKSYWEALTVKRAGLGDDAGLLGAAALALQNTPISDAGSDNAEDPITED